MLRFSSTPFNHGKMQHSMNTPYARFPSLISFRWLCQSTWLFCFSNILKIYAFSQNFPLVGSVIGGFYWLFLWLCLSLWLIQDSNWKGRALWRLSGGLATILQNWISCNEQKMREAHITRRGTSFYLLIFIEKNHQP